MLLTILPACRHWVFIAVALTILIVTDNNPQTRFAEATGKLFEFPEPPPQALDDPNFRQIVGEPVLLTDYISRGQIDEGRRASAVVINETVIPELAVFNNQGRVTFTGFLTVNKDCDSNLFFWFVPAKEGPESAPLVLWLQGGPGGSSLFGLFVENGPWILDSNLNLAFRYYDWTRTHSIIYVDSPVGTGFSYTNGEQCYAKNQEDVARDLSTFLSQFFLVFPEFSNQQFYIFGESSGGKSAAVLAHKITAGNSNNLGGSLTKTGEVDMSISISKKINLAGVAIGNSLCDPFSMSHWGNFLYGIGLIGSQDQEYFSKISNAIRDKIRENKYTIASELIDNLITGLLTPDHATYFGKVTGAEYYFNFLWYDTPPDFAYYSKFLDLPHVRRAIHVGHKVFQNSTKVQQNLLEDLSQSVHRYIESVLDSGVKMLFYNGQLDITAAFELTQYFIHKLHWRYDAGFQAAPRDKWKNGTEISGYIQRHRNLALALVLNAGHMVAYDQPSRAFDLLMLFTKGRII
ncbi:unnamed protein product [Notodromas monacha]|uniref:Carboxypeptidase n=1 Tax=Notodromas monacha TaxID=399045 RepID=A0A7R9BZC4_9CRUS|nr:unnamed protein product [Notodromas monacha]CAG0923240.1 unnamed protein product [Notodromas monacha]